MAGFLLHHCWSRWCGLAQSDEIPGAVDCINNAKNKGLEIFYVANRQQENNIDCVIDNLNKLNLPYADKKHVLLPSKSFDKEDRFKAIEKDYDIIAYVGDNIADFPIEARGKSLEERNELVDLYREEFGRKFICLPNPMYGEWEYILIRDKKNISPTDINKIRKKSLKINNTR